MVIENRADLYVPLGEVDLSSEQRVAIVNKYASLRASTSYSVLEVKNGAGITACQYAFRDVLKKYHPDSFYGKKLGIYNLLLNTIVQKLHEAYHHVVALERGSR